MTTDCPRPTRAELAGLLTEAAHGISGILTTEVRSLLTRMETAE